MTVLSEDERIVLNNLQGGLPVRSDPFLELEEPLGLTRDEIVRTLEQLNERGLLSRFGAVLNTRKMGGDSRLAAMSVPSDRLRGVIDQVNGLRTVTHNYRRSHRLNLWFVLSASDASRIDRTMEEIEDETGLKVYDLPKLTEYYVGLRFYFEADGSVRTVSMNDEYGNHDDSHAPGLTSLQRDVVLALQDGLPIQERPYKALSEDVGEDPRLVLSVLSRLLDYGKIKRLGCIPNHYALGIKGNGMAVFDVPDDEIDEVGERLGRRDEVTHCYRRPRHGNVWPYNLFAMVHDRTRDKARMIVEELRNELQLKTYDYDVLFSEELLKKTGLRLTERTASGE